MNVFSLYIPTIWVAAIGIVIVIILILILIAVYHRRKNPNI